MSYSNIPDTLWADTTRYYKELEEQDAHAAAVERIIEEIRPGFLDNHALTIRRYKGEWAVALWRVEDGRPEEIVEDDVLMRTIKDAAAYGSKMIEDELYRLAKEKMETQVMIRGWEG
jgi:hypothetical protein